MLMKIWENVMVYVMLAGEKFASLQCDDMYQYTDLVVNDV